MNIQVVFRSLPLSEALLLITKDIQSAGGELFLVGGCVRDMILGIIPNDLDVEIYGLDFLSLEKILVSYGNALAIGKAFGILKLSIQGEYIDFSLPRKDSKVAEGHTGFQIEIDSSLSYFEATKRRDFTINSILYNPLTGVLIDPHDGQKDLENGILRITDREKFMEDPLRVYRGIRFASRFGFDIEANSLQLFKKMIPSIAELSKERIGEEWRKLFLQSKNLRKSMELLWDIGILERYFPYIAGLRNVPQDPRWHPEGDVWVHTCMVLEQAQGIAIREKFGESEKIILYFSALCHDFGKLTHTQVHDDGRITAHGHEEAGVSPSRFFLQELFFPEEDIKKITNLIANHVTPSIWYNDSFFRGIPITDGAFRKLSKRLSPANIRELSYLCEADVLGRGEREIYAHTSLERVFLPGYWIRKKSDELGVDLKPAPDIFTGKELIQLGIEPGKYMGEVIRQTNYLFEEGGFTKEEIVEKIGKGELFNETGPL